jgi:serine/threonine-protein kinase
VTAPLGRIVALSRAEVQPRTNFDHYEVQAELARGGTAGVYLARDTRTGEQVALKMLAPHLAEHQDLVARLFNEHGVSARARHPGLLNIRGAFVSSDGIPYLVMEYLDGENLGALAARGTVELGAIVGLGAQIAAAVAALHETGVIHCDVKASNVLVLYQAGLAGWPRIKVIDFGISQWIDQPPAEDGTITGTPSCMPPEQWNGSPVPKSDVYAFGCLLYELITGSAPFSGTLPQLMLAHTNTRPARPSWFRSGTPMELERLVMRALAKDPGMRPAMRELGHELADLARACPQGELLEAAG